MASNDDCCCIVIPSIICSYHDVNWIIPYAHLNPKLMKIYFLLVSRERIHEFSHPMPIVF